MWWDEIESLEALLARIEQIERSHTDRVFDIIYAHAGDLQAWYNEPNKVPEAWLHRVPTSQKDQSAAWGQVGETVVVGLILRELRDWTPVGLPIGAETRLTSSEAVIHIDVKTHKEGDTDIDRTQDVRPEQISGTDCVLKIDGVQQPGEQWVQDKRGRLGDCPPKLPPLYDFGPGLLKVCVTLFVICVYRFDPAAGHQFLRQLQLFTVPNGLLRWKRDFRDIFSAGKDGRKSHRYRIKLPELRAHAPWRWRKLVFEPHGVIVES